MLKEVGERKLLLLLLLRVGLMMVGGWWMVKSKGRRNVFGMATERIERGGFSGVEMA